VAPACRPHGRDSVFGVWCSAVETHRSTSAGLHNCTCESTGQLNLITMNASYLLPRQDSRRRRSWRWCRNSRYLFDNRRLVCRGWGGGGVLRYMTTCSGGRTTVSRPITPSTSTAIIYCRMFAVLYINMTTVPLQAATTSTTVPGMILMPPQ